MPRASFDLEHGHVIDLCRKVVERPRTPQGFWTSGYQIKFCQDFSAVDPTQSSPFSFRNWGSVWAVPVILIDIKTLDDCKSVPPPRVRVYLAMADNTWKINRSGGTGTSGHFPTASPTKFGRVRRTTKGGSPFAIGPVTFAWTTVAMDKSSFRSPDPPLRCACGFDAFGVLINSQPFQTEGKVGRTSARVVVGYDKIRCIAFFCTIQPLLHSPPPPSPFQQAKDVKKSRPLGSCCARLVAARDWDQQTLALWAYQPLSL